MQKKKVVCLICIGRGYEIEVMEKVLLSVIIPTRNRANMLRRCLESIANQNLSQHSFETIVVDNGSTDETRDVVGSFVGKIANLRCFYEDAPGLHVGRHKGLEEAQADILVYTDDDIKASPTWLEGVAEAFMGDNVMLVGGRCPPLFESQPPQWLEDLWQRQDPGKRILPFLSLMDLGDATKEISPQHVFGCNFSIRKHMLLEADGFHPDAMPPELIRYRGDGETYVSEFIYKRGYQAIYHPKATVYHHVPNDRMTKSYFCRRSYIQGISDSYTHIRNGGVRYHWTMLALRAIKRLPIFCRDRLQASAYRAYLSGYRFHQLEVKSDPMLHEWVVREAYLGCRRFVQQSN